MNLLQTLEQEEIARLNKEIPDFNPGDTVIVSVNVVEGSRKRVQAYEGVVIAKRNRGLNSGFIVRKISNGEGVERTFQTYSPLIAKIEVKRRGDVRRAKLYYLRGLTGKKARIKENCPSAKRLWPPQPLLLLSKHRPPCPAGDMGLDKSRYSFAVAAFLFLLCLPLFFPGFQRPVGIPSFDPRQVPISGRDSHLPAVAHQAQTEQALRQRFAKPPVWQPELRGEPAFVERPVAEAAVLLPLVQRTGGLTVLLTQRSAQLSSHSGQVAFPGGRTDPEDRDAIATALREAWEEVGLAPQRAQVLGSLPVYTTGSAFNVTPVVALVPPQPAQAQSAGGGPGV